MRPLLLPLLSPVLLAAGGNDCDVKALRSALEEASPRATAGIYTELAHCDPEAARELAEQAFSRILPGEEGTEAAVAAIEAGATEPVRQWIEEQQSDERAHSLAELGEACSESPQVASFFVESKQSLGDRFWRERWQRGLADCRVPQIQELLRNALQEPANQADASRFGSILEVFSQNLQGQAIPWLKALALSTKDLDIQLRVVGAFPDAAGVGRPEGMDAQVAAEAVKAIQEIAPKLDPKAVEQARIAVQSLGDEAAANALAAVRYADRQQPDGTFLWGAVAVETATCKNGKVRIGLHYAPVIEHGTHWPDQMQEAVDDAVKANWTFTVAARCKGSSAIEVMVPPEPFADHEAYQAWLEPVLDEVKKREAFKLEDFEEEPLTLD